MPSYSSEAAFSRALCKLLTKHNIFHQRIESGETGRGIPDLYIRTMSKELWVELKNAKLDSIYQPYWQINWRPAQQAWAHKYHIATGKQQNTVTFVAMKDGFITIPMFKRFIRNVVQSNEVYRSTELIDFVAMLK